MVVGMVVVKEWRYPRGEGGKLPLVPSCCSSYPEKPYTYAHAPAARQIVALARTETHVGQLECVQIRKGTV